MELVVVVVVIVVVFHGIIYEFPELHQESALAHLGVSQQINKIRNIFKEKIREYILSIS